MKQTKIKMIIINFALVFLACAFNLYLKSINVVNVELTSETETITYVKKYAEYFEIINYITILFILVCVLVTVGAITLENRKVIKRFDYLVSLFENVGLSKIKADKALLTDNEMQVVKAWNCSIEEISQLNELREKYFKNMVHDLKTPVQLLKMNAQMIEFEQGSNEYTIALGEELTNLERSINNYLLIEKITFFEKVQPEQFLIEDYFAYQIERYEKLQFTITVESSIAAITSDRKMFDRIVENLIDNAMKYGADKTLRVVISADKMTFTNRVKTTDLGNIFTQQRNYSISGNGLGVEIINTYIRLLGLRISSQQVDDQFIVTITKPQCSQ